MHIHQAVFPPGTNLFDVLWGPQGLHALHGGGGGDGDGGAQVAFGMAPVNLGMPMGQLNDMILG